MENAKNKRGRPPQYRESLIYFALAVKIIFKLSWRDNGKIPDHTTLFYKASQIDKEFLGKCIKHIAAQIIATVLQNFFRLFIFLLEVCAGGEVIL
ncbi:hypothetical protein GWK41_04320 [Persephonella atlantica]|uniref:Transposase n=1 Tax=Persephonella atlantica TaxID=2699429 RepID=A0ABS1GHD6_9AQUI|nr:hypothetical protein [Persephonella atlantica]MBK3332291.1 hypothetical protein [Persephonella atlantica]